jgi:hypothetical protein
MDALSQHPIHKKTGTTEERTCGEGGLLTEIPCFATVTWLFGDVISRGSQHIHIVFCLSPDDPTTEDTAVFKWVYHNNCKLSLLICLAEHWPQDRVHVPSCTYLRALCVTRPLARSLCVVHGIKFKILMMLIISMTMTMTMTMLIAMC